MAASSEETPRVNRSNSVRLRTLIVLRWIAIIGQVAAITVAQRLFALDLNLGLCFLVIGASIAANLTAAFVFPENKRLTESEVAWMLLFDIAQLALLLALTGGLNNPFALLILAPVTISATALKPATTAMIGAATIVMVSVVTIWHLPLRTELGFIMRMPQDFVVGFWTAIVIGVVFLGLYASRVTAEVDAMSDALAATQMALAREQKLTDLGGVVAAAAHELGTPLATIMLTSTELIEELKNDPGLADDAALIREQAARCRDILRSMGQVGKDDLHMRRAPLVTVVREAAEPHLNRGRHIEISEQAQMGAAERQPTIDRRPEIIHGLRNLVQNAVDFAESTVWIDISWSDDSIHLKIADDGPGFPPQVLGRIGDPFVRFRRQSSAKRRPGYESMGLGLFIAKTLLERTGAKISFANGLGSKQQPEGSAPSGAIVEAAWTRDQLGATEDADRLPLGENAPLNT
ncbi:MAG: sensor histidine kinase RegB [Boseongicola sp.]